MACSKSGDPEGCAVSVGATIYAHYGWDVFELAASGEDNPLPSDADELRIMGHQVAGNLTDPMAARLVGQLDLDPDHASNFEPAFVEGLKWANPRVYDRAIEYVREDGWDLAYAKEYTKLWIGWSAGSLPGGYFVTNE
jgi:hypothetical protein